VIAGKSAADIKDEAEGRAMSRGKGTAVAPMGVGLVGISAKQLSGAYRPDFNPCKRIRASKGLEPTRMARMTPATDVWAKCLAAAEAVAIHWQRV